VVAQHAAVNSDGVLALQLHWQLVLLTLLHFVCRHHAIQVKVFSAAVAVLCTAAVALQYWFAFETFVVQGKKIEQCMAFTVYLYPGCW